MTGWTEQGVVLVEVALDQPGVRPVVGTWPALGMAGSESLDVDFDGAVGTAVGGLGWYLERPGFWHGSVGVAACWYGGARGAADVLAAAVGEGPSPHQLAHLGAVAATCSAMGTALAVGGGGHRRRPTRRGRAPGDAGPSPCGPSSRPAARACSSGSGGPPARARCASTPPTPGGPRTCPCTSASPTPRPTWPSWAGSSSGTPRGGELRRLRDRPRPARSRAGAVAGLDRLPVMTWGPPRPGRRRRPPSGRRGARGGRHHGRARGPRLVGRDRRRHRRRGQPSAPAAGGGGGRRATPRWARRSTGSGWPVSPSTGSAWRTEGAPTGGTGAWPSALVPLLDGAGVCLATWRGDGHPDHEAAGAAAAAVCSRLGVGLVEYPVWAWHWDDPADPALPLGTARRVPLDADDAGGEGRRPAGLPLAGRRSCRSGCSTASGAPTRCCCPDAAPPRRLLRREVRSRRRPLGLRHPVVRAPQARPHRGRPPAGPLPVGLRARAAPTAP